MNTAKISIKSVDSKNIYNSIILEIASNESVRSNVKIKVLKDELLINFEAKDINALKIIINHVLRLIITYEEAIKIKGEK
ncbi:MAG: KEOPS complex subunit Pcc1 [Candidatus Nanoarchaeia archaeon]|nr:KEOPS complex subunit Pcc1 [Candidatus Nanoarchaeia archaeon]